MRLQARPSGLPAASSDSRQATRAVDHTRPVPFHLYVRTLPSPPIAHAGRPALNSWWAGRHRLHMPAGGQALPDRGR